ncbi:MAG: hypothetical protein QOH56_3197 [Pseudonocardiales bacterium]|nr:hypothetical protein [Frankiales bacterium]MDQ1736946.1 hypothetical protein [Pseudonocardiales bacterium]
MTNYSRPPQTLRMALSPSLLNRTVGAVLSLGLIGMYLRWAPLSPDLAAQVARANVVRTQGVSSWWTGWFGGMLLPNYSLLTPSSMALIGVRATAVLAAVVTVAGVRTLARDSLRPRATVIACAATSAADVLNGRVTFAAGVAVGVLALLAIRRPALLTTMALSVGTFAASPLAGLFLGIAMVAIAVSDPKRRRPAIASAVALVGIAGLMTVLFPGTGIMPFSATQAIPAALCGIAVGALARQRGIRVTAFLSVAAMPVFLLFPGAVGENITRFAWVAAVPAFVASAAVSRRVLIIVVALMTLWPASDLVGQLHSGGSESSRATFYQPLIQQLMLGRAQDPQSSIGQRLEALDTSNHWPSVYLSSMSLARGWDRQADRSNNAVFYQPGALTADSYHAWLHDLAVGWVAVPNTALDYASKAEAVIVAEHPAYLKLIWSNSDWRLYRVADATPFAVGARVTAVHDTAIDLQTQKPGAVTLRLRWSPYLTLLSMPALLPADTCITDLGGFVHIAIAQPGSYELVSHFNPGLGLGQSGAGCRSSTHNKGS